MKFSEPILTIAVLDFGKQVESYVCLKSIKEHVKVPHKVVFCDNGSIEDYPFEYLKEGLIDQLITNRDSNGLGIGTRDLFAAIFSPVTIYLQNDQYFARDLTEQDFVALTSNMGVTLENGQRVASISLAGSPCGEGVYSERAHLISTRFYKDMEREGLLGYHGAGKWHDGPWREAQIQSFYKQQNLTHWQPPVMPWVADNGVFALRDMGDGGVFIHRTDTKQCWVILPPKVKNPAYPKMNDEEFALCIKNEWPDGKIPEAELKDSFDCWSNTDLVKMQGDYIKDTRERFKRKVRS